MNQSLLMLTIILVLLVVNTIVLKPKSRILSEVPSKLLLFTLVSVLITDAVSTKGLAIGTFEIALLLVMVLAFELLLLLFQRFASENQVQELEQVLDFNKSIRQKFAENPRFMVAWGVMIVMVVAAFWIF